MSSNSRKIIIMFLVSYTTPDIASHHIVFCSAAVMNSTLRKVSAIQQIIIILTSQILRIKVFGSVGSDVEAM